MELLRILASLIFVDAIRWFNYAPLPTVGTDTYLQGRYLD